MKIIKRFTAVNIDVDGNKEVVLSNRGIYIQEFDTEDEAHQYAYEQNKWASWAIVPIIRFDNL